MQLRPLGNTGLSIPPLVFGGNVFGWTVNETDSLRLIAGLLERGFNAIDTADVYSAWAPGNRGGESETIIGRYLKLHPGARDKMTIFTKVGSDMGAPECKGLSARWIARAVEDSLRRLNTDYIDLYFSHWPDSETPYEETLRAYEQLLQAGKIRATGASNLNATQLADALHSADENLLTRYQVLQPEYNLYDRAGFEGDLSALCVKENIGVVTYYSLASGFLSGKYRRTADLGEGGRSAKVVDYLNPRGLAILNALDTVAQAHQATPAEVALAWLMQRTGVTAPIASGTTLAHIDSFVKATSLRLSQNDVAVLDNPAGCVNQ